MAKHRGSRPEETGAEQSPPVEPSASTTTEGSLPEETGAAAAEPPPKRALRPGLVEVKARVTCQAHGMPHYEGERFFVTKEVADQLVRKGRAELV